jgi:lysophospholipase L1-like esterase
MSTRLSLLVSCLCVLLLQIAGPVAAGPERFEGDIRAFETLDLRQPPPKGEIVFVGSSSIVMWKTLAQDLAPLVTIRRGFGGSMIAESTHFASRIILPYQPRTVVLYAGENDLASGLTPIQVADDFRRFVDTIHAALPRTRILFIAMKPSISRAHLLPLLQEANARIRALTEADPRLGYIDVATPMLDGAGRPRPDLLVGDNLHLNAEGYRLWTTLIKPHLTERSRFSRNLEAGKSQRVLIISGDPTGAMVWGEALQVELALRYPKRVTVEVVGDDKIGAAWGGAHLASILVHQPDVILLDYARSDARRSRGTSPPRSATAQGLLAEKLLAAHTCELFVLTPTPVMGKAARRFHPLSPYTEACRELAGAKAGALIDLADRWESVTAQDAARLAHYLPDGEHPSAAGIQEIILPAILDTLEGRASGVPVTQRLLDGLPGSLRFTGSIPRGARGTVTLKITNPLTRPLSFQGGWSVQDGEPRTSVTPRSVGITLAPRATKTLRFQAAMPRDGFSPEFHWLAVARGGETEGALAVPVRYEGVYGTPGRPLPASAKLAVRTRWQVDPVVKAWSGPGDCSAMAWMSKDQAGIRVRVEVTDDVLQGSNVQPWDNDAVELHFDFRPLARRGTSVLEPGWFQLIALPAIGKTLANQAFIYALGKPGPAIPGLDVTSGLCAGGYWVEVFLPTTGLSATYGTPGEDFLFNYSVNDADAGTRMECQLHWTDGYANHLAPGLWARMRPCPVVGGCASGSCALTD